MDNFVLIVAAIAVVTFMSFGFHLEYMEYQASKIIVEGCQND